MGQAAPVHLSQPVIEDPCYKYTKYSRLPEMASPQIENTAEKQWERVQLPATPSLSHRQRFSFSENTI